MIARFLFVGRMQLQINNERVKTKVTPVEADWSQQYQQIHGLFCFINKYMQIDTDINVNTDVCAWLFSSSFPLECYTNKKHIYHSDFGF